jgi:protein SCO1/2
MLLWWLAFFQAPNSAQDWLTRLQVVCFGSMENGLPNGGGWILLIAAPALFMAALFVISGAELKTELLILCKNRLSRLFLICLLLLVSWQTIWVGTRISAALEISNTDFSPSAQGAFPDNYPRSTEPAPDFSLTDQHGENISLRTLHGKTILLTFAFAHCQTICPSLVATGRAALDKLPSETTLFLIVTLDPYRDTPGALPGLAKKWKLPKNALVLSGEPEVVENTIKAYNIPTSRDDQNGDVTHPAVFYIIAPDGSLSYTFLNPTSSWLEQAAKAVSSNN